MPEQAIPVLPCRSLDEALAFYGRLGFGVAGRYDEHGYAVVRRGGWELHFFVMPELDPAASYSGCYVRVPDVDGLYAEFAAGELPSTGIPRLGPLPEDQPYGMREFHLVDPDGNLVRVGQPVGGATA